MRKKLKRIMAKFMDVGLFPVIQPRLLKLLYHGLQRNYIVSKVGKNWKTSVFHRQIKSKSNLIKLGKSENDAG